MDWYYAKHGRQEGPVEESVLRSKLHSGEVAPSDLVWREGMPEWAPAESVAELRAGAAPSESVAPSSTPLSAPANSPYQTPQAPLHSAVPGQVLAPVAPTSGLAIASLTCGIIGLLVTMGCLLGAITGIPAVICGHAALRSIKSSPTPVQGQGMAIAGLVTGYLASLGTLVLIFIIVFAIAAGSTMGPP